MIRWLYLALGIWIGILGLPLCLFVRDEWRRYKRNKELL